MLPTSKNYFYSRFGVPSITYEVADEEDRGAVARSSALFARALVDALAEDTILPSTADGAHPRMLQAGSAANGSS